MTDEEDIVVNIESEPTTLPADGTPSDPAVADLKTQFEDIQRREREAQDARAASDRRAADAVRAAEAARKEVETARTEVADSQLDTVTTGIAAAQAEAEAAEREYSAAFEAGDGKAMATAQRKMARAESKLGRLDEAKADLETRKSAPRTEGRVEAPQRTEAPSDPVEAYIAGRTEPTQKWLRAHKEWVSDPKKNAQLTSAHWGAVAADLRPDTDEYFAHIENAIGLKQATAANGHAPGTNGKTPATPSRRSSAPVAPVITSGGGTSGGSNEVKLTKGEAKSATDGTLIWNYDDPSPQKKFRKGDPIGIQEMARRKLKMQQQGLYDKSLTES
jgi:hypothetical protein